MTASTKTLPVQQYRRALIVAVLCSVSALAIIVWYFVSTVSATIRCKPPPDGFEIVYCGSDLTAVRSKRDPALFAVLATQMNEADGLTVQTFLHLNLRQSRAVYIERIIQILQMLGRQNILLLGLGGGAIPLVAASKIHDCKLTAVDISQDSLNIVRKFVHADDGVNFRYVQQSAENFLKTESSERYDAVVQDMYNDAAPPGFIYEPDYMQNILRVLNGDGVFISNVFTPAGYKHHAGRSIRAVSGLFQDFGIHEVDEFDNLIVVASKVDTNLKRLTEQSRAEREDAYRRRDYDDLLDKQQQQQMKSEL